MVWTPACSKEFEELKKHLCSDPVLRSPDFNRPFILQTDASNRGVGEVLSQIDAEGEEHLVAYFSQKLLEREEKYSTIGKKCLVIKLAIQAFQVYMYLLGKLFTIQTDYRSLKWLDRLKENNTRLTPWTLALQPYQYQVKYQIGKANSNANGLSRID